MACKLLVLACGSSSLTGVKLRHFALGAESWPLDDQGSLQGIMFYQVSENIPFSSDMHCC